MRNGQMLCRAYGLLAHIDHIDRLHQWDLYIFDVCGLVYQVISASPTGVDVLLMAFLMVYPSRTHFGRRGDSATTLSVLDPIAMILWADLYALVCLSTSRLVSASILN